MQTVARWTRFEASFSCSREYDNPTEEVRTHVHFANPAGVVRTVNAFWDGDRIWRVRFSPDTLGKWNYSVNSSDPAMDGESGSFECIPYTGTNPLYQRGAIRVSASGTHFEHFDGTPFFWLGDTVWNGPLKADRGDWSYFLADRAAKGFNVIQFVPTQWVAAAGNADLRAAFTAGEEIRLDPIFFQWLDHRVAAINDFGMLACPALLWSAPSKKWALPLNPGTFLSEPHIMVLARYLIARYGAHHATWMLAADGDYRGAEAERWKRIGRVVFQNQDHPATMHPMGQIWVGEEFSAEPWFQFHGYQSSHWGNDESLRWIYEGPPSTGWKSGPAQPVINLEPCYEAHLEMWEPSRPDRRAFDARDVRKACYWSLLAGPPAGVTYGCHGVWSWETSPKLPMNHPRTGLAPDWRTAMALPGSSSMKVLKDVFSSIAWWELRPSPDLLRSQPGQIRAGDFVSPSVSASRNLAMIYLPDRFDIDVRRELLAPGLAAEWIQPSTGDRTEAMGSNNVFHPPAPGDWLLLFRSN